MSRRHLMRHAAFAASVLVVMCASGTSAHAAVILGPVPDAPRDNTETVLRSTIDAEPHRMARPWDRPRLALLDEATPTDLILTLAQPSFADPPPTHIPFTVDATAPPVKADSFHYVDFESDMKAAVVVPAPTAVAAIGLLGLMLAGRRRLVSA